MSQFEDEVLFRPVPRAAVAGMGAPTVLMRGLTAADFFSLPPSNQPQALIDGVVYIFPPQSESEAEVTNSLAEAMAEVAGEGRVILARDCWLSDSTVLRPDVAFVSAERVGIVGRYLRGTPDIVVHIGRGVGLDFAVAYKLPGYAAAGVREAWIVDLDEKRVTVFSRVDDGWDEGRQTWFGSNIQSTVLGAVAWAGPAGR